MEATERLKDKAIRAIRAGRYERAIELIKLIQSLIVESLIRL